MIWWLLGALAVGALIYLGVVLTVAIIRNFRTRRNTKVLVADMERYIMNLPDKDKHTISASELENSKGKKFISEFDPITGNVFQTKICDKGLDPQVQTMVNRYDGYIIVDN